MLLYKLSHRSFRSELVDEVLQLDQLVLGHVDEGVLDGGLDPILAGLDLVEVPDEVVAEVFAVAKSAEREVADHFDELNLCAGCDGAIVHAVEVDAVVVAIDGEQRFVIHRDSFCV